VNWNILVTLGKEIKRDSTISENESREAYKILVYKSISLYINYMRFTTEITVVVK